MNAICIQATKNLTELCCPKESGADYHETLPEGEVPHIHSSDNAED